MLYQHYTLEDWWPPSGTGAMSPLTFENINDGKRDRIGVLLSGKGGSVRSGLRCWVPVTNIWKRMQTTFTAMET